MQGIERKVQQLTKVIYHLNAKSEDGGELGDTASSYENEIEGILRDASERVKRFQAAAAHSTDEKLIVEKVREVELKYEQQKQRALKEMAEFKTRATEEGVDEHKLQDAGDMKTAVNALTLQKVQENHLTGKVHLTAEATDEQPEPYTVCLSNTGWSLSEEEKQLTQAEWDEVDRKIEV